MKKFIDKLCLIFLCLLSCVQFCPNIWAANEKGPNPNPHEEKSLCGLTLIQYPDHIDPIESPSKETLAALQISQQLPNRERAILFRVILSSSNATYGVPVKIISLLESKPLSSLDEEAALVELAIKKFINSHQTMATTSRMDSTKVIVDFVVAKAYPVSKKMQMLQLFILSPELERFAIDSVLGYLGAVIKAGSISFKDAQPTRRLLTQIISNAPSPEAENLLLTLKQTLVAP